MVAELTDYSNMAQAFALMPVVWSVGATIGLVLPDRPKIPYD